MIRHQKNQVTRGVPAPDDLRQRAQELVEQVGDAEAARHLRLTRPTLARVLAGLPVVEGTLALLREGLGSP